VSAGECGAHAGRIAAAALALAAACAPAAGRDVVPETHDVHLEGDASGGSGNGNGGAYAYVTRRPHGVVALAGTQNLAVDDARRIVDRLADELDACARGLETQGTLTVGAARYVVAGLARGADVTDLQLETGTAVARNALLCLVAPARAVPFPPATGDGGVPALMIEATWNPIQAGKATVSRDGGGS
jgi:hypothetical protein